MRRAVRGQGRQRSPRDGRLDLPLYAVARFVGRGVGPRQRDPGRITRGQQGDRRRRQRRRRAFEKLPDAVADCSRRELLEPLVPERRVVGCREIHEGDLDDDRRPRREAVLPVAAVETLHEPITPIGIIVAPDRGYQLRVDDVGETLAVGRGGIARIVERLGAGAAPAVVVDAHEQLRADGVGVARTAADVLLQMSEARLVPHRRVGPERLHVIARRLLPLRKTRFTHARRAIEIPRRPHVRAVCHQQVVQIRGDVVVHKILDDPLQERPLEHPVRAVEVVTVARADRDAPTGHALCRWHRRLRRSGITCRRRRAVTVQFLQQDVQRHSADPQLELDRREVVAEHGARRFVDLVGELLKPTAAQPELVHLAAEVERDPIPHKRRVEQADAAFRRAGRRRGQNRSHRSRRTLAESCRRSD